jgi:hypothetical protein
MDVWSATHATRRVKQVGGNPRWGFGTLSAIGCKHLPSAEALFERRVVLCGPVYAKWLATGDLVSRNCGCGDNNHDGS